MFNKNSDALINSNAEMNTFISPKIKHHLSRSISLMTHKRLKKVLRKPLKELLINP